MKDLKVPEIANYIVKKACEETTSGNYHVFFDDIAGFLKVDNPVERNRVLAFLTREFYTITEELDSKEEILSETWESFDSEGNLIGFDLNLALDYCPNIEGGAV